MRPASPPPWQASVGALARLAIRLGGLDRESAKTLFGALRMQVRGGVTATDLIRLHAHRTPGRIAIKGVYGALTWAELDERVDRLVSALAAPVGVVGGGTAIVVAQNTPEFFESLCALLRMNTLVLVTSRDAPEKVLNAQADRHDAQVILRPGERSARGWNEPTVQRWPDGSTLLYQGLIGDASPTRGEGRCGRVAILEGGGEISHPIAPTLNTRTVQLLERVPVRPGDRHLATSRLDDPAALTLSSLTLAIGGTVLLEPASGPEPFLRAAQEHRATSAFVTPAMMQALLALPAAVHSRYAGASLRLMVSGGRGMPADLRTRATQVFGHLSFAHLD